MVRLSPRSTRDIVAIPMSAAPTSSSCVINRSARANARLIFSTVTMSFDKADTSEAIKTYQTQSYHKTSIRARDFGKGEEIFTNCLFIRCDKWKVLYLGGNHVLSTTTTAAGMDAVSTSTVLLPTTVPAAITTTSPDDAA